MDGDSGHQVLDVWTILQSLPIGMFAASLLLLAVSALVSGSEVALFSITSEQLKDCKESDKTVDKKIYRLLEDPKGLLATILILNNLVNVGIVTLSSFGVWQMSDQLGIPRDHPATIFVLTVAVTAAVVFFGEIVPKIYATQHNMEFSRMSAGFISASASVLRPVALPLTSVGDLLERRLRQKRGYQVSVNELNEAVELVTERERDSNAEDILKGIVNFGSKSVRQIMRSRIDIEAVDLQLDFHELMDRINKTGYSRIPVYEDSIDNVRGILYIKDLLPFLDRDEHFRWQELVRTNTFFVPEAKMIDDLLRDFQRKHVHMAIIVDEYGGTVGLVTLEDIMEEIVGDINDEFDNNEQVVYRQIDASTYIFEGKTMLNDFTRLMNLSPELFEEVKGDSETLSGLLLELFRKMPKAGEQVRFQNMLFTVVSVNERRIKSIRVFFDRQSA